MNKAGQGGFTLSGPGAVSVGVSLPSAFALRGVEAKKGLFVDEEKLQEDRLRNGAQDPCAP
jgi:hypothetical protein